MMQSPQQSLCQVHMRVHWSKKRFFAYSTFFLSSGNFQHRILCTLYAPTIYNYPLDRMAKPSSMITLHI